MDPATIVGLTASCFTIGQKFVSVTIGLQGLVRDFKDADKNISRLTTQLNIFQATIDQFRIWLDGNPSLSSSIRDMKTAFEQCDVVLSDLEKRVQAVQPRPGDSKTSLINRLKHTYHKNLIQEAETMINNQFTAFNNISLLLNQ